MSFLRAAASILGTTEFSVIGNGDAIRMFDGTTVSDDVLAQIRSAAAEPDPVTVAQIKAEAQRRIIARTGASNFDECVVKQLNAQMRATELVNKKASGATYTDADRSEEASLQALADAIKLIRTKSNEIERMDPRPSADAIRHNSYWTD